MEGKDLLSMALAARKLAYTPYSGFQVGAALLCEDETRRLGPATARRGLRFLRRSVREDGLFWLLPSPEGLPGRNRRISARPAASAGR